MKKLISAGVVAVVFVQACVTINVYFPAAEAAQVADRIIEDVRGTQESTQKGTDGTPEQPTSGGPGLDFLSRMLGLVFDTLIPPAHAQVDFDASSPAVRAIQAQLKDRFPQLLPYFSSGAIGYTTQATIGIRDRNLIPLPERSRVLQLVAQQNNDWDALYREIARANGHPEWEADVRNTFADRHVAKLDQGWWHQDRSGEWVQKR